MFKSSQYNLYFEESGTIFNTLNNCHIGLDKKYFPLVKSGLVNTIPATWHEQLVNKKFIIPKNYNELNRLKFLYDNMVFDNTNLRVVLEITYQCNLMCPYCFQDKNSGQETLGEKESKIVLAAIKKKCLDDQAGSLELILFGGEPLVKPELCLFLLKELKAWCNGKRIGFTGLMTSNGTLFTEEKVKALAGYCNSVQITLDGPQTVHDSIRVDKKGNGTYHKILQSVELLINQGINVHLRVMLNQQNRDTIRELLKELNKPGFLSHPLLSMSLNFVKQFGRNNCNFKEYIEPGSEIEEEVFAFSRMLLNKSPVAQVIPCVFCLNSYCITPKLKIHKCISRTSESHLEMGYIGEDADFHFNHRFYDYMSRNPETLIQCRDCAYLPICGGGCPMEACAKNKTFKAAHCGNTKNKLHNYLERYFNKLKTGTVNV